MEKIKEFFNRKVPLYFFIIIFLIFTFLIFFYKNQDDSWTLFLYSSSTPDKEKLSEVRTFLKDKEFCMNMGTINTSNSSSYECGKNCYLDKKSNGILCSSMCDNKTCKDINTK